MATGQEIVDIAATKLDQDYVFGAQVPLDDVNWSGPWDCAEYCSWAVYQVSQIIYGCTNNQSLPARADAWTGSWKRDARTLGQIISIQDASYTPGAMLLRRSRSSGHIAISSGAGNETLEARGARYGVMRHVIYGRTWNMGVLVPGINFDRLSAIAPEPVYEEPFTLRTLEKGVMEGALIQGIQEKLQSLGFYDSEISGQFDMATEIGVRDYQISVGLTPDGQVDVETADELGVKLDSKNIKMPR